MAEKAGRRVPRNYGDPAEEYAAARSGAVVVARMDRALLRVWGRDPVKMVHGLVSNDVAGLPVGGAAYATLLTPKGRLVADMRIVRRADDLLLEFDAAALDGLTSTLKKFVPPLFARFEDVSSDLVVFGVYGPAARAVVLRLAGDAPAADAPEDAALETTNLRVLRSRLTGEPGGYDVIVPAADAERFWRGAVEAGARPAGLATLDVLRIEAGVPAWGAELDETVIPLEAGLRERAISETKGCYTGQEVIIRILHRGHVNRHLRGLLFGELPPAARGTELFRTEGRPGGVVTSACFSPLHRQTIGLGFVRREVEPPGEVRLGSPEGPEVRVVALPFETTG